MCESEREQSDEARDARYFGRQSRRPGAIGMPSGSSARSTLRNTSHWSTYSLDVPGVKHDRRGRCHTSVPRVTDCGTGAAERGGHGESTA